MALDISSLPGPVLLHVFSFLSAADYAACACVQRAWRQLASEDWLWQALCRQDWLTDCPPRTPDGRPCVDYKAMYQAFHAEFSRYGILYKRAKCCWLKLESWSSQHIPQVAESLGPGTTEAQLDEVEQELGVRFPAAMRMLYRLHDGQRLAYDENFWHVGGMVSQPSAFHGLLGGYSFYDHTVSTRLLPLERILMCSKRLNQQLDIPLGYQRILIATSFNFLKLVFLDCNDGLIYIGTRHFGLAKEMIPCLPASGDEEAEIGASSSERGVSKEDGLLRWLEEYANRLESGLYGVRNINPDEDSRGICLYPELPPLCTTAVTRRVQVRCSALFVPEACILTSMADKHFFSYSVRMRLLPWTGDNGQPRDKTVQLRRRHWVIKDMGEVVNDVEGEAVIGLYPLLKEGDPEEFVYQSCTGQSSLMGSVEGNFLFVPGRIEAPTGDDFLVEVAQFPLSVPTFVY